MRGSISRQALVFALVVALPATLVVDLYVTDARARLMSLVAAALGMAAALILARSFERRIRRLTGFVDHIQDPGSLRPRLTPGDDELGELARSLCSMASQMDDLVNRLSTELTRREAILASMTEAVLAVDSRMSITFCNNSFVRAIGDHGTFEGLPLIRVVRDPGLMQVLKQVLDTGETVRRHLKLSLREGLSYDVYAAPLASGFSRGAIAILHDVTPIERLERTKRDFIANVSHEFRTPLATIRGYAETLLDGGLDDRQNRRRFVEIIQANGVRLSNIAVDLLTLSELEVGAPGAQPGPISVRDVVSNALHAVEPSASLLNVRLRSGPVPEVYILGHGIRFEQALLNLFDNAVKFNRECGEVRVEVSAGIGGHVAIRVSDTGIGIPAEDCSRIFERFYRVDKARSRAVGGTGLGLSIVKHAIEQMNGTIAVESEIGKGSRFTITLPEYARREGVLTP